PVARPVLVTLNPVRPIPAQHVLGQWHYDHPVFDLAAIRAQGKLPALQGRFNTWYAGAWCGYGFHEDGLKAGLAAARQIGERFGLFAQADAQARRPQALPEVRA